MIPVSISEAVFLYLALVLLALFSTWLYFHFSAKKRKILSNREELYLCEYCHCVYLYDPLKPNTQCPTCQSYNKHNRYPTN